MVNKNKLFIDPRAVLLQPTLVSTPKCFKHFANQLESTCHRENTRMRELRDITRTNQLVQVTLTIYLAARRYISRSTSAIELGFQTSSSRDSHSVAGTSCWRAGSRACTSRPASHFTVSLVLSLRQQSAHLAAVAAAVARWRLHTSERHIYKAVNVDKTFIIAFEMTRTVAGGPFNSILTATRSLARPSSSDNEVMATHEVTN